MWPTNRAKNFTASKVCRGFVVVQPHPAVHAELCALSNIPPATSGSNSSRSTNSCNTPRRTPSVSTSNEGTGSRTRVLTGRKPPSVVGADVRLFKVELRRVDLQLTCHLAAARCVGASGYEARE